MTDTLKQLQELVREWRRQQAEYLATWQRTSEGAWYAVARGYEVSADALAPLIERLDEELRVEKEQRQANFEAWQAACGTIRNLLREQERNNLVGIRKPTQEEIEYGLTLEPLAVKMLKQHEEQQAMVAAARLEEAKWWHTQVAMAFMCDPDDLKTETRARIAALESALAAPAQHDCPLVGCRIIGVHEHTISGPVAAHKEEGNGK